MTIPANTDGAARAEFTTDAELVVYVDRRGEARVIYDNGTVLTVRRVPRTPGVGPLVGYTLRRDGASVWPGDPVEATITLASIDAAAIGHAAP